MDANRQIPFQLAKDSHWRKLGSPSHVQYNHTRRVLQLACSRLNPNEEEDEAEARSFLEWVPATIDRYGTRARWDGDTRHVVATGAFDDEVPIYSARSGWIVHDVAIGYDDVLYLTAGGRIVLKDLRNRWEPIDLLGTLGFHAWRLAPNPSGGAFCLDRVCHKLARVDGLPLMARSHPEYAPGTFRPINEEPNPPRARVLPLATWPHHDEREVAIACSTDGRLALLTWDLHGGNARLRLLGAEGRFGPPTTLIGVRWPYSFAWVGTDRVAVLVARKNSSTTSEAPVYQVSPFSASVEQVGDLYPLRDPVPGKPFLHCLHHSPEYATRTGSRSLYPISWSSYSDQGMATNARAIDSGEPNTIWHRLYLEAVLPPGCGIRVWLTTTDELREPDANAVWHEHRFGSVQSDHSIDVPKGVWLREASEVPFATSLLSCERKANFAGLWTALIQRPRYRVRTLTGRYLWVRLELHGDGRSTPEVAALRAYANRRSYVREYLPQLYQESVFGQDADAHGTSDTERVVSTGADFLERFVATFESVLTPLEDRIASAWLLTSPRGAPEETLEWLATWIGFSFVPALPVERRRSMLENAMELYRRRGTLAGLKLAIDLATGGAVTRREVIVVEDYRLRRTFATILGANLVDEADPLLPGLLVSGNSLVGDTLFLGTEHNKEFLALYSADLAVSGVEAEAITNLFERLADRATVLVHNEIDDFDLGLIRQIINQEAPAHVAIQVLTASQKFLVGMSSLVGIDTYLGRKPTTEPVRVNVSTLGHRDRIGHLPSLDPRLGASPAEEPIASLVTATTAEFGQTIVLDGGSSRSPSGRRIVRYHWTRID